MAIATASTELVTNALTYAGSGTIELTALEQPAGMQIVVVDHGPGIADTDRACQDGVSSSGGRSLGIGLGAVRRLMDAVTIDSRPGEGTKVIAQKWLRARR